MRVKKNKTQFRKSTFEKTVLVVLLSSFLSFLPIHKSNAAIWPAIDPTYQRVIDTVYEQLQGVIMSALKQAAAKMINQQVNKLVGGSASSGTMFITNWEDFLVNEPKKQADKYINDYLSQLTKGRGSASSYISSSGSSVLGAYDSKSSEGFFGGKVLGSDDETTTTTASSGNYYEELLDTAKKATTEKTEPEVTYEGNPSDMLSGKNFSKFNLYLSPTAINSKFAMGLVWAPYKQQQYLQNQEKIAAAQSVAYKGFKGATKDGIVITPGSTVEQAVANAQDIGNKILASSEKPAEMISSIVSQIVTQALQQGIGEVSSMVDQQVNQVTDKVVNARDQALSKYGPSSLYNNSSSSSGN